MVQYTIHYCKETCDHCLKPPTRAIIMANQSRKTMNSFKLKPLSIQEALESYGGTVKFFGTNEALHDMADLLQTKAFRNVLGCCAGGDQCLTIMGAAKSLENFYAFDNNPAQLFILAYKANLIANKNLREFSPSLAKICSSYKNQVTPSQLHPVEITKTMNRKTRKIVPLPPSFMKKYVSVLGNTDFIEKPVYWKDHPLFLSAIRTNLKKLRFVYSELLLLPEWFPRSYFDLIYLSDIFFPTIVSKHWLKRLKLLLARLKPGGVVLGYLEFSYENSIIEFLRKNAGAFGLRQLYAGHGMIVLEKYSL
jgi:hypothetical protein